jgi:SAM-dependent methyltransferase
VTPAWASTPEWLREALACPSCGAAVADDEDDLVCSACPARYPQHDPRVIDLMPADWQERDRTRWSGRQQEMTEAYAELARDRDHSLLAWQSDYGPLAEFLAPCAGRVLDVGGGSGIARHWLPEGSDYVSLEPSRAWLEQPWSTLSDTFPCLAQPPRTVRGVAERLPFVEGCFDAALMIWSLNHVSDPNRALGETARAIRPRGRLVLVLDDVPPSVGDVIRGRYPSGRRSERAVLVLRRLLSPLGAWPIQPDHLPLRERALLRRARRLLELRRRVWVGAYLVLELDRRA